ncbi:MAG: FtsW/RodA/SpoVE family cell cycle protein [Eubacteriales bacterium]
MKNTLNKNMFKYVDWFLLILMFIIVGYSLLSITNATASPFTGTESSITDILANLNLSDMFRQLMFFIVGLAIIVVITLMDYNSLRHYTEYIFWVCIAFLAILLIPGIGSTQNGTTGWFMIAGYGLQPSEFTKVGLILVFARIIANQTEGNDVGITKFSQVWPLLWRFMIPFVLVAVQPDMGTALVYCAIFIGILFIAKTSIKIFGILFGIAGASAPLVWLSLAPYQRDRLFSFLNQNSGATDQTSSDQLYHAQQAKIAIGSGQLFGKGLFASGTMSQLGFVPEARNDFIFSVTTEAFGFIGAMVLITLYALLIVRLCMLAMRAKDDFGTYIIIGLVAMLLFHILENIGMNLGILPITGISLPLFSYGGSNLLATMVAVGFVLSVDMRRTRWSV